MAKKDKRLLGKLELMIMQVVWETGEATVRQVRNAIAQKRDLAYSTVMTMMRKLEQKGVLTHRTEDRTYVYRPLVSRGDVERSMLRDLLQNVFGGSYQQLINALVEHENLPKEELIRMAQQVGMSAQDEEVTT